MSWLIDDCIQCKCMHHVWYKWNNYLEIYMLCKILLQKLNEPCVAFVVFKGGRKNNNQNPEQDSIPANSSTNNTKQQYFTIYTLSTNFFFLFSSGFSLFVRIWRSMCVVLDLTMHHAKWNQLNHKFFFFLWFPGNSGFSFSLNLNLLCTYCCCGFCWCFCCYCCKCGRNHTQFINTFCCC